MEVLFNDTARLLLETQRLVHELNSVSDARHKVNVEAKIEENKQQLELDLNRLQTLVSKQPPQYRHEAKSRLDQLSVDYNRLKTAVNGYYTRKVQMQNEATQREQLFSMSYSSNSDGMSSDSHTAISMGHSVTHNQRLRDANNDVTQLTEILSGSLQGLRNQYGILKKARTTLLDVSNTLGLSNTVMRLIERRTAQDKYIFWGGVAITLIIVFLVLRYFL